MFRNKSHLVIGLTTYDVAFLRISVPALARLGRAFTLIIHNDNPAARVTVRDVRRLGYRGRLRVINSTQTVGLMRARLAIVAMAMRRVPRAGWIMFANDDDIVVSTDIAPSNPDNFAIIQNCLIVSKYWDDVVRAAVWPDEIHADDAGILIQRPHLSMAGTLVRMDVMASVSRMLNSIMDQICEIDDSLDYIPPADRVMWAALNTYARARNAGAAPIFMDRVNYISVKLPRRPTRYGRPMRPDGHYGAHLARAMARYSALIAQACQVPAPVGH